MYALKETNVRNLSQAERQEAVNEIRLLASVQQNAAISGFHEAFIDGNRLCIVMEYAPFGDLSRALRKRQAQRKLLPEDLIWSYFIQIARGLQALHAQKILHRDVKTANVLRMSGEIVKLGDLGVAKLMKGAMTNTQIGTPHYMPPEVWRNRPYTFNSDVWALGCVLFEMCTFSVPFEARSMEELRFKVMKGKFPALPAVYSSDMQKMVRWLMIAEPSQRPDIDQVLEHASVLRRAHLAPEPEPANGPVEREGAKPNGPGSNANASEMTLGTIKVPKNLKALKKRLPAPSYPSDQKEAREKAERAAKEAAEAREKASRERAERELAAAEKAKEARAERERLAEEQKAQEARAKWGERERRDARNNLPPVAGAYVGPRREEPPRDLAAERHNPQPSERNNLNQAMMDRERHKNLALARARAARVAARNASVAPGAGGEGQQQPREGAFAGGMLRDRRARDAADAAREGAADFSGDSSGGSSGAPSSDRASSGDSRGSGSGSGNEKEKDRSAQEVSSAAPHPAAAAASRAAVRHPPARAAGAADRARREGLDRIKAEFGAANFEERSDPSAKVASEAVLRVMRDLSDKDRYEQAVQRVKLPLISGNGAVPTQMNRPREMNNLRAREYAPAAPLPGGRVLHDKRGREPGDILEGLRAERAAAAAVLARAGLVPAGNAHKLGLRENVDRENNGPSGAGKFHHNNRDVASGGNNGANNANANAGRRVGLSNRDANARAGAGAGFGGGHFGAAAAQRPARRPAPMARGFHF